MPPGSAPSSASQQNGMPPGLMAHFCASPTLSCVTGPRSAGGASSFQNKPQHATVASGLTAHMSSMLPATEVTRPSPSGMLKVGSLLRSQQPGVPSD